MRDYRLIDADSHTLEPPHLWTAAPGRPDRKILQARRSRPLLASRRR